MNGEQHQNLKSLLIQADIEVETWPSLANSTLIFETSFTEVLNLTPPEEFRDEFWDFYICHDNCHDDDRSGRFDDRNTVWAVRKSFWGTPFLGKNPIRILGRELPYQTALALIMG